MKVVILAGGLGSRLAEETAVVPKPLVMIGPKPILWHVMKIYAAAAGKKTLQKKQESAQAPQEKSDIKVTFVELGSVKGVHLLLLIVTLMVSLFSLVFVTLGHRRLLKPLLVAVLIGTAALSYFTSSFGISRSRKARSRRPSTSHTCNAAQACTGGLTSPNDHS